MKEEITSNEIKDVVQMIFESPALIRDRVILKAMNINNVDKRTYCYKPVTDGDIVLVPIIILNEEISPRMNNLSAASFVIELGEELEDLYDGKLLDIAKCNTFEHFQPLCCDISGNTFLKLLMEESFQDSLIRFMDYGTHVDKPDVGLMVTSELLMNGATMMFLPGVCDKLCEIIDDDLMIVFTSTDEAMVHPISLCTNPEEVKSIIYTPEFPNPGDKMFLSRELYFYSRSSKSFSIYEKERLRYG